MLELGKATPGVPRSTARQARALKLRSHCRGAIRSLEIRRSRGKLGGGARWVSAQTRSRRTEWHSEEGSQGVAEGAPPPPRDG